jgi:hypothetical protein
MAFKRPIAWLLGILSGLIVCAVIIAAILPAVVSTAWGTKTFLKCVNERVDGSLNVHRIVLHWMGPQEIFGIEVLDKENTQLFSCEKISTDASLWQTLFDHDVGTMTMISPHITFKAKTESAVQKNTPIVKSVLSSKKASKTNYLLPFSGTVAIENAKIDILSEGNARNAQLNASMKFQFDAKNCGIAASIHSQVMQENSPCGLIDAAFTVKDNRLLHLDANMSMDKLSFQEPSSRRTAFLRDLSLKLSKPNVEAPFKFTLDGAALSKHKDGGIHILGSIDKLFDDNGKINLENSTIQWNATLQQFPAAALDFAARFFGTTDFPFSSIFGEVFNAAFSGEIRDLSGPLKFNLNAPNMRTSLTGQLVEGILTIDETIYAQAQISPELSRLLIKSVESFPIAAFSAKNPIAMQIDADGFSFPIFPFDRSKINMPAVRLELGQIACQNKNSLSTLLNLFKSQQRQKETTAWVAPMDLCVKNGMIDCKRTEILVSDTFDVAVWGKIDLVNNSVDMDLGLTADCLKTAFKIDNLPQNYVLQLPIKGKIEEININSVAATTKIAALLAWQQKALAGKIGKGNGRVILEGLLNGLASLPDKNSEAPPAKHPFPWEKEEADADKENPDKKPSSKKTAIKKGDKPLKQLLKILRNS